MGKAVTFIMVMLCSGLLVGCGGSNSDAEFSDQQQSASDEAFGRDTSGDTSPGLTTPSVSHAAKLLNQIESDVSAEQYQRALNKLHPKCRESDSRLADFTVNVQGIIKDKIGQDEPLISILEQANRSIPKSLGKTKCLDIFAAYALLRTQG